MLDTWDPDFDLPLAASVQLVSCTNHQSERRRADSIERTAAKRLAKRAEKARALAQRNLPLPPS